MSQTVAFFLTLLIEVPIVFALLRGRRPGRGHVGRVVVVAVAASSLTHPLLWMAADHVQTTFSLLAAEGAIALVEAAVLAVGLGVRAGRALGVSLVANGASLGIGLLLQALG